MGVFEKLLGWEKAETFSQKAVASALHAMAMDACEREAEAGDEAMWAGQDEAAWQAQDEAVWKDEVEDGEEAATEQARCTEAFEALLDKLSEARDALQALTDTCMDLRDETESKLDELGMEEPGDILGKAYAIWEERRERLAGKLDAMAAQADELEARQEELEALIESLEEMFEDLDGF